MKRHILITIVVLTASITWAKVDRKAGFIRLTAEDTKEKKPKKLLSIFKPHILR